MGAPFEGNWGDVNAAYFVGLGGGELVWLLLSLAACALALIVGGRHERHAYDNTK